MMESLQALQHCTCRRITFGSIGRLSRLDPATGLKHHLKQGRGSLASTNRRTLSTTSIQSQSQPRDHATSSPPSPPSENLPQSGQAPPRYPQVETPQPPPSSSSKEPRPTWKEMVNRRLPQGTPPPSSPFDMDKLRATLDHQVDLLNFIPPRASTPSSTTTTSSSSSTSTTNTITSRVSDNLRRVHAGATHDALESVHLRLTPLLGRTQPVAPETHLDLQSAFRILDVRCAANKVRRDMIAQRTHVRKGMRKKLLRSERWRVLFKQGFLNEVARVRRMKRQGW